MRPGDIAASTVNSPGSATASLHPRSGEILKNAGIDPAPTRSEVTWSQLLRSQAAVACDFATIDTVTLSRFYVLLFIDIGTRTVYLAGVTDHPSGVWTTQTARNLLLQYGHQLADNGWVNRQLGVSYSARWLGSSSNRVPRESKVRSS